MSKPDQIYTVYIKTTPQKVWDAITNPEFAKQYWGGYTNVSDWKKGSKWQHITDKSVVSVVGNVIESTPPELLVVDWASPKDEADISRVTYKIKAIADLVCLEVIHGDFTPNSTMADKVSQGWPLVLSSLKSFLETDRGIDFEAVKQCA
jgi:uncharacterized protein YndB with AHSA1/START domain